MENVRKYEKQRHNWRQKEDLHELRTQKQCSLLQSNSLVHTTPNINTEASLGATSIVLRWTTQHYIYRQKGKKENIS